MTQQTRTTDTPLSLVIAAWAAALGGCSGIDAAAAEKVQDTFFPYVLADGAVACGDGTDMGRPLEYYYFERINDELGADPALAAFAAVRGVTRVDSCESARRFATLHREYIERQGANTEPAAPPAQADEESKEGVLEEAIADGFVADSHFTFVVRVSGCSGVLISPNWMLTAAHCFTVDGWVGNDVYVRNTRINDGNLWVTRHPDWNGLVTSGYDVALVWSSGWLPPADVEGSWLRVFGGQLPEGARIVIHGYGAPDHQGGSGVWRESQEAMTTDFSSEGLIGVTTETGEGRLCEGDSGGPAVTAQYIHPFVAGVGSYRMGGSENCPYPGEEFYYTQVGGGPVQACASGGEGSRRSCSIQDTINSDPDTPDDCTRGFLTNYSWLKCW